MSNSFFWDNKQSTLSENVPDSTMLGVFKEKIKDAGYFEFLEKSKYVSFFFDSAIHIYGFNSTHLYNSIEEVNRILVKEYGAIFGNLVAFGQDVFGNQFCFDISKKEVVVLNSESGERERISKDFTGWIKVLVKDIDYYSGNVLLHKWNSMGNQLNLGQRLCPKIPFIMGGEYIPENLYAGNYPSYIKAYANIAKQVYGMPDGTKVQIKIT